MAEKRRWSKCFPALVFMFFFTFSSLFNFVFSIAAQQSAGETNAGGGRIGLGFLGGYGLFSSSQASGGAAFGATFTYGFGKNIAIELAGIYLKTNVASDPNAFSKGKMTTLPMQFSLLGRFPINKKLTPYLLAGGSYFLNNFTLDRAVAYGWNAVGFTLTENINNAFGFHFGGGLEFALGKSLSAGVDVRYCIAQTKGNWSLKDNKSSEETSGTFSGIKLNTMMFAIRLKYFFK
jgi:outer membrane protein W